MKSLRLALFAPLALIACSGTGAPGPVIANFIASPATIGRGGSSTLSWTTTGATQISLSPGFASVTGTSVTVTPMQTTTYTLTASGAGGSTTAQVTVTVTAQPAPVIISFEATPPSISRGKSSTLTWGTTDATSFTVTPDPGPITGASVLVTPTVTTTYTLTATGPAGSATAQAVVTVLDPVMHLQYTDPGASAGGVRLVNSAASTDTRVVLNAVVGTAALSAYGVALNLPFDTSRAALSAQNGFMPNVAALDPGTSPATAAAAVPTSGPLQGALVLGLARKKLYASDGNVALPAGTLLFSIAFDLQPGAAAGVVFDGVTPGPKFDAALLNADGTRAIDRAGFAIGQLITTF